jgi:hypothetical protein
MNIASVVECKSKDHIPDLIEFATVYVKFFILTHTAKVLDDKIARQQEKLDVAIDL